MPETQAHERLPEIAHPAANGAFLIDEPGTFLDVPNIHRAAHDPKRVVILQSRDRAALVEFDSVPGDAISREELAEDAGMLTRDVLKYEKAHNNPPPASGPMISHIRLDFSTVKKQNFYTGRSLRGSRLREICSSEERQSRAD